MGAVSALPPSNFANNMTGNGPAVKELNRSVQRIEAMIAGGTRIELAGREGALERLMDAYGDDVLHLAYFYVKDRALAEDIFQEVFTKVYLALPRFRGESSPKTWIYRIAINQCRDRLRSWSMRNVLALGESFLGGAPEPDRTEDAALAAVDREALLQAILQLPVEFREVVLLYYYDEMDVREAAQALSLSAGTVKSRLHRARQKLKVILAEGGFSQ